MANVKHSSLTEGIEAITGYAPVVLFLSILAMYGLTGWMQHHFMRDVLVASISKVEALSIQFPILIQSLRFILGFVCVSFFTKGRWFFGGLVFCLSIWLALFEYSKVDKMAMFWTNVEVTTEAVTHSDLKVKITSEIVVGVMTILIWGALILEFFLAAWVSSDNLVVTNPDPNKTPTFSRNGTAKKTASSRS